MGFTRGSGVYKVSAKQQGRAARAPGNTPGLKHRTVRRRKSNRGKKNEPDSIDDEDEPVATPPPVTRNTAVTCLTFSKHRKALYPEHFFCGHCDNWERDVSTLSKKAKRTSKRFCCEAMHFSALMPTQLKKAYHPSMQVWQDEQSEGSDEEYFWSDDEDLSDIDEDEDLSDIDEDWDMTNDDWDITEDPEPANDKTEERRHLLETRKAVECELLQQVGQARRDEQAKSKEQTTELETHVRRLQEKVELLTKSLVSARQNVDRLRHRLRHLQPEKEHPNPNAETARGCALENTIAKAIAGACRSSRVRSQKKLAKAIANAAFNVMDGVAEGEILTKARQTLRNTVFSPFNIARLMDLNGGALNLSSVELLRTLETMGEKYKRDTMLPSAASIKRVFKKVELLGDIKVPYELMHLEQGEAIKFDEEKVLVLLIKAYGLHETGKVRNLRFAQSMDGANLTKHLSHVMGGLKICDPSAICPLTKAPLFMGDFVKAQSRNLCFPWRIHMGNETGEMYNHFSSSFNFMETTRQQGIEPYLPFIISTEIDMSATWKGLKRGGGAKVATHPCHCCGIYSKDLVAIAGSPCDRWCRNHPNVKCYHHPMVTDAVLEGMAEEVKELEDALKATIQTVRAESKITREDPESNHGRENAQLDCNSIWFRPTNDDNRNKFSLLLNTELQLRDLPRRGNLTRRRADLKKELVKEYKLNTLSVQVKACERSDKALFLVMQAIPCVLHMENRVGLKFFTMIVLEGLSNARKGLLFHECNSEVQRIRLYIESVERTVNRSVLGNNIHPSSWTCPYDEKVGKLAPLSLDNNKTRKVVNSFEELVEVSVSEQDRKDIWNKCIPKYREAMELARQKADFTDDDIVKFQKTVDDWFQDYVGITGLDGMTNYIHMLSSGHVAEYMIKWRNLYKHSQQGWEAFNNLLKTFFFRRTSKGGGRGARSKLKPIARWLQRRMLFLSGMVESDLENIGVALEEEAEEQEGQLEDEDDEQLNEFARLELGLTYNI